MDSTNEFKKRIETLLAKEKDCEAVLESEKKTKADYAAKRVQVDAASIGFRSSKTSKYELVVQEVLAHPEPDFLHLPEWYFKDTQAELLTERLSQDLAEQIQPAQEERVVGAQIALFEVRMNIAEVMEQACEQQLRQALEPLAAQHGSVYGTFMGAPGEVTSALLEQLRAETASARHVYYGAVDALTAMRERRAKIDQARAACGVIGRAQVHSAIPY